MDSDLSQNRLPWLTRALPFGLAVSFSIIVILMNHQLRAIQGGIYPMYLGTVAITCSAFWGGFWPGMTSSVLITTAFAWFGMRDVGNAQELNFRLGMASQLLAGVCISLICEALHRHRRRIAQVLADERDARENLNSVFNSITDKLLVLSHDLKVISFNRAAQERWNIPDLGVGKSVFEVLSPSMAEALRGQLEAMVAQDGHIRIEVSDVEAGRNYEVRTFPSPDGYLLYFHNITERVQTGEAVSRLMAEQRQVNALLDSLLTHAPVGFAFFDRSHRCTRLNEEFAAMSGMPVVAHIGEPLHSLLPDETLALRQAFERVFTDGAAVTQLELQLENRHWHAGVYPVAGSEGNVQAVGVVVIEISDRKAIEDSLVSSLQNEKLAREESERANRLKEEFLANLSHELRTPLTSMLGWTELLLRSESLSSEIREGLHAIDRSSHLQLQLINDLIDMSRISVGKVELELEFVELSELVRGVTELVHSSASVKQVELTMSEADYPVVVRVDTKRFTQVLWNLLTNAIKFTPRGGSIHVTVVSENQEAVITCSDNGVGIASEALPNIFERFSQGDSGRSKKHGGLGLGLAIAKQLMDLHGGTITAASRGQNQGSDFVVRIPTAELPPYPRPSSPPKMPPVLNQAKLEGLRILLVEDDVPSQGFFRRILEREGATVVLAGSALEARNVFEEQPVDVLVSDIGLPEEDGYSLIRSLHLKTAERQTSLPALALTAFASSQDRSAAFEAGFDSFLAKPVTGDDLVRAILELERH